MGAGVEVSACPGFDFLACGAFGEGLDGAGAVAAEPAGVVEELEALALSLARPGSVAGFVDGDSESCCDRAVLKALGFEREDVSFERV